MKENLKVSVFIPTFNRAESLKTCLESIINQTYKNFEVIIVDDGSTDNTKEIIDKYIQEIPILFFQQIKKGIVGAANEAVEKSTGDIFTRTDDDVIVSPTWLEEIVKTFNTNGKIGGVTGPTVIPQEMLEGRDLMYFNNKMKDNPVFFWKLFSKIYHGYFMEQKPFAVSKFFRSGAFSLGSNYKGCLELEGLIPADHLEACNSSTRRELIEKVGGYDGKYVGTGEYHEPDLAFKVKKLGYHLVFNPKASLNHCPSIIGVFKARSNSYERSQNFILFYFRHIKPNTLDKFFRFFSYLTFINIYWFFKFITTRNLSVLMGIPGTFVGLIKYLPELRN